MKKVIIAILSVVIATTFIVAISKICMGIINTHAIEEDKTTTTESSKIKEDHKPDPESSKIKEDHKPDPESSKIIEEPKPDTESSKIIESSHLKINNKKPEDFRFFDLKEKFDFTVEELNYFLDKYVDNEDSLLHHQGQAFYEAQEKSGYNAIFLIALAAQESGWNVSSLHASKCNPYSIAMYDWDPEEGYIMGNTYSDGIINGAIWISNNYYDAKSQKTLYDMQHKVSDHIYASDPNWEHCIADIMETIYNEIEERRRNKYVS